MTQTKDTYHGRLPSGNRRPGRVARGNTRMRVSSEAVVSAYIREIARPRTGGEQHDPQKQGGNHARPHL